MKNQNNNNGTGFIIGTKKEHGLGEYRVWDLDEVWEITGKICKWTKKPKPLQWGRLKELWMICIESETGNCLYGTGERILHGS